MNRWDDIQYEIPQDDLFLAYQSISLNQVPQIYQEQFIPYGNRFNYDSDSDERSQYQSNQRFDEITLVHLRFGSSIKFSKLSQFEKESINIRIFGSSFQTIAFDCQSNNRNTKHNIVALDLFGEKVIQYNPTTHKIQQQIFINPTSQNIVLDFQVLKIYSRYSGSLNINLRNKKLKIIKKFANISQNQFINQQDKATIQFNGDIKKMILEQYQENKQIMLQQGHILIDKTTQQIENERVSHLNIIHDEQVKAYCPSYRYLIQPLLKIVAFSYKDLNKLNIVNFVNLKWSNISLNGNIKFILPIYYGILVVYQINEQLQIKIIDRSKL